MARFVEMVMGAAWWHAPDRWQTADGFVPYHVVVEQWELVVALRAWERLNIMRAHRIPQLKDLQRRAAIDVDLREAFGG